VRPPPGALFVRHAQKNVKAATSSVRTAFAKREHQNSDIQQNHMSKVLREQQV